MSLRVSYHRRRSVSPFSLNKRELRERFAQLNSFMFEWDPLGVMNDPKWLWPRDEYECLARPLLTLLQSGASQAEIENYLRKEIVEHFGLSPEHYDLRAIALRVRRWFDRAWRDSQNPVTIFVALLDEGVDVWRPIQARPLAHDLFHIVGVEAEAADERWQFPAGAIVRCESKVFSTGQVELVAVESVWRPGQNQHVVLTEEEIQVMLENDSFGG
jgi:hypothetical protein